MFTFAHKGGQIIKQHTQNIMSCFIEKQSIEILMLQRIYYPIIIKRSGHSERISKLQFIYDVILLFSYASQYYLYLIFSYALFKNCGSRQKYIFSNSTLYDIQESRDKIICISRIPTRSQSFFLFKNVGCFNLCLSHSLGGNNPH